MAAEGAVADGTGVAGGVLGTDGAGEPSTGVVDDGPASVVAQPDRANAAAMTTAAATRDLMAGLSGG